MTQFEVILQYNTRDKSNLRSQHAVTKVSSEYAETIIVDN